MEYKFTNSAEQALELANDLAAKLGHNYIGTEHILYGLTAEGTGVASKVLEDQGVIPEGIKDEIDIIVGGHSHTTIENKRVVKNLNGNDVIVVQDGEKGEFVGRLDIWL